MSDPAIYAAGAVCWRLIDGKIHVLLIHRTVYGDVTIPKGKVDPGETLPQTAVREIAEETGLAVANGEVAAIEWVTIKKARTYLSYTPDVEIIDAFAKLVDTGVTRTFALIALRHGKTVQPGNWDGPDCSRPLTERGVKQAAAIVPTITAWQPLRIVSSTATRCVTTVAPLAAATGIQIKRTERYSQDAFEQGLADVRSGIGKRVRSRKTAVICSHGPVLPEILHEIALATGTTHGAYISDAAALETGSFSVVHLSADNPSAGIVAIETHSPAL